MGTACAWYLAQLPDTKLIRLIDHSEEAIEALQEKLKIWRPDLTVDSVADLESRHRDIGVLIATCGYRRYHYLTYVCSALGIHMVDLGGNRDVVRDQFTHNQQAINSGATIIPDSGLAPGLINILAMQAVRSLQRSGYGHDITVKLFVGGLPRDPGTVEENPLQYGLTWSAEGLINEYVTPGDVLHDGVLAQMPALSGLETLVWHHKLNTRTHYEAFVTGGGSSNLPNLLAGQVRTLEYRTVRYPGHQTIIKAWTMLGVLEGPARQILTEALEANLNLPDFDDIVLGRVSCCGRDQNGLSKPWFCEFAVGRNPDLGLSAMAQTTGFSAGAVAAMLIDGTIKERGVLMSEACVPGDILIERLASCGIAISSR